MSFLLSQVREIILILQSSVPMSDQSLSDLLSIALLLLKNSFTALYKIMKSLGFLKQQFLGPFSFFCILSGGSHIHTLGFNYAKTFQNKTSSWSISGYLQTTMSRWLFFESIGCFSNTLVSNIYPHINIHTFVVYKTKMYPSVPLEVFLLLLLLSYCTLIFHRYWTVHK